MEYPAGTVLANHIPSVDKAELVQLGGQKAVYKAAINGQTFALKLIALDPQANFSESAEPDLSMTVERARREVRILEKVDVPVLASVGPLSMSTVQLGNVSWIYFTEEWIEGRTVRDMIRGKMLSPVQVSRLGVDLIQATCWLSSHGLVHRDIKPANVMWANDRGRFVLLDPGIALDLYGPSLTPLAVSVGTIAYLSPEQTNPFRKRSLDFRSDLFSVGIVMYEAALAEHPFMTADTTPSQVVAGILKNNPQSVAERREGFPPILSDLISRLLGKAPHLRYRTCERALVAMEQVAFSLGVEV